MVAMVTWLDLLENFPTKNIRSQVVLTDLHGVDLPRQLLCEKSNIQKNYIICCYFKKSHTLVSALATSGRICKKPVRTGTLDPPGTVGDGNGQPADLPHDGAPRHPEAEDPPAVSEFLNHINGAINVWFWAEFW